MTPKYAHAAAVLPPELLAEIQSHFTGLLWIPTPKMFYEERRRLVQALHDEGVEVEEIARLSGVTPRRVYQILQKARAGKKDSDTSGSFPVSNQVEAGNDVEE